jgi:hypothetical protein
VSGETEASVSGWTTDTLREHLAQQIAAVRDSLRQQVADVRETTRQQVTDQRDATRLQVDDMRRMLDERYATQTKALDAAFKAAEQAVAVALANAEKATGKAELAAERRFESVNEFRRALTDQTATFLPRVEYDTAHAALSERITANSDRVGALELRLTSRLDRGEGADAGSAGSRTEQRLNLGVLIGFAGVLIAAVSLILLAVHK